MTLNISLSINPNLYLKNPIETELGRKILSEGLTLIHRLGMEAFTFKKLAEQCKTTEASIYRYFKDKHQFMLYFNSWYWRYILFVIDYETKGIKHPRQKLRSTIGVLGNPVEFKFNSEIFNIKTLHTIIVSESTKVYFSKQTDEDYKNGSYEDYLILCKEISKQMKAINDKIKFPQALVISLIESAHLQSYFAEHLPSLTDINVKEKKQLPAFLEQMVFNYLEK